MLNLIVDIFVSFVGECWSGPEAGEALAGQESPNKCVMKDFEKCEPNDTCVGKQNANAIYSI